MVKCAIIVPPSGGAVDVTPPIVKESFPPNYSSFFKDNKIRIFFNEYVQLKDYTNQITISPIPENDPDYSLKGKSIQVEFKEKLKDSITYTINFGNSIVDYTAGNIFSDYKFVFSTSNHIDTSEIRGKIVDAFTLKPIEKCFAMIYKLNVDSIPIKEKPLYFAKTDKSGLFEISNIRNGKYKIFALIDANSNYLYDLPNESIAFIDTLVVSNFMIKQKFIIDTTQLKNDSISKGNYIKDSIKFKQDSLFADSINRRNTYKLFMFQEKDTVQQLLKASLSDNIKLTFIFKQSVKNLQINPLNVKFDSLWKIEERNPTNDTIIYWLLNPKSDSLILQVVDAGKILDTAELRITKQKSILGKGTPVIPKVTFKTNIGSGGFDYYKSLILYSPTPIMQYDFSQIKLMVKKDSIQDTLKFAIHFLDTINKKLQIDYKWLESKDYTLLIPKGTFYDVNKNKNDTILIPFKTKTFNDYGTIQINVTLPDTLEKVNYIVQLMNDKENVLIERPIIQSQKIKFDFVNPGKYLIKVIRDSNGNGKWDTGNYMKKIQVEKVYYYHTSIIVKAGWDITDQEVDLNKIANP